MIKLLLLALAGWLVFRMLRTPRRPSAGEAMALLELAPGASADEVRSAHRRLIARVHPDTGGSAVLARQVNAARDVLLAQARGAS